jgi:hypothetical protein
MSVLGISTFWTSTKNADPDGCLRSKFSSSVNANHFDETKWLTSHVAGLSDGANIFVPKNSLFWSGKFFYIWYILWYILV